MNAKESFRNTSPSLVHKYQVKGQLNLTAKKLGVSKVYNLKYLLTTFNFIKFSKIEKF